MKKILLGLVVLSLFAGCGGVGGDQMSEDELSIAEQALVGVIPTVSKNVPAMNARDVVSNSVDLAGLTLGYRLVNNQIGNTVKRRMTIDAAFDETFSSKVNIKYGDNAVARSCTVSVSGKAKLDVVMKAKQSGSLEDIENLGASAAWSFKFYNPNVSGLRLTVKDGSKTILDKNVTFRFTTSYKLGASVADGIEGKADAYAKINGEEIVDGGLMADFTWTK